MPKTVIALDSEHWRLSLFLLLLANVDSNGGSLTSSTLSKDRVQTATKLLDRIHDISNNNIGSLCVLHNYTLIPIGLRLPRLSRVERRSVFVKRVLEKSSEEASISPDLRTSLARTLIETERHIQVVRVINFVPWLYNETQKPGRSFTLNITTSDVKDESSLTGEPWFVSRFGQRSNTQGYTERGDNKVTKAEEGVWWTYPYFSCKSRSWISSLTLGIYKSKKLTGLLVLDVDISDVDINQCDQKISGDQGFDVTGEEFLGSHKCHDETTVCQFVKGGGWDRGKGYICQCRKAHFNPRGSKQPFNGSMVEVAWHDKSSRSHGVSDGVLSSYDALYVCVPCAPGCNACSDPSPCLASYDWTFRAVLCGLSMGCVLATFVMMGLIFKYRKLKVFSLASPCFLMITLCGCAIMYMEAAAIFPELEMYSCIATKWTRHLGFLITYSALLMKTWRVSLTYRVKSAHKLKLTDKQLLHWMFPILAVMVVYLSAWTLSDPPVGVTILDTSGLKFKQCSFGWWDHCLATGEFLFLMWGIKVCVNVRKARTFFDEARLIRYSIYNIAVVNLTMLAFHTIIFPHVGPDLKFFLGFLRTQLSTTVTISFIFGPKFYRVYMGTADEVDDRLRARGATVSMYGEALGTADNGDGQKQKDVYVENEELKEEIQKLAGQIQYVKVVGMLMDNHHIKNPKKDGYFSKENFVKNMGLSDCTGSGEGSTTANGDLTSAGSSQKPKKKRHSIFSDALASPSKCLRCSSNFVAMTKTSFNNPITNHLSVADMISQGRADPKTCGSNGDFMTIDFPIPRAYSTGSTSRSPLPRSPTDQNRSGTKFSLPSQLKRNRSNSKDKNLNNPPTNLEPEIKFTLSSADCKEDLLPLSPS